MGCIQDTGDEPSQSSGFLHVKRVLSAFAPEIIKNDQDIKGTDQRIMTSCVQNRKCTQEFGLRRILRNPPGFARYPLRTKDTPTSKLVAWYNTIIDFLIEINNQ